MRILLVEDDPQLGRATQLGLDQLGYTVDWLQRGDSVVTTVLQHDYEAILLDLSLPGMDGMQILRQLRQRDYHHPVLVITARDQIPDRIAGLDAGADDFVIKPFDLDELSARLRAASRRVHGRIQELIRYAGLLIDVSARSVQLDGQPVALTAKEFSVLLMLIEHQGQIVSREQLESTVYGWGEEVESNAIQVHIHHLRKKLGKSLIRTVHAVGYMMDKLPGAPS
ncbi:response regulator transcription factor [Undibacterium rugosum]|uniref:Response regulator transcription factor n=1 Tax=Undibacterium rugosum TaxID=2762291 RepID=A0A923I0K9_9BURK|nr:response regulator transcription factor [Undibacterium rugosum]MBC3934257.1 response regulator transcription factor [Undibacterium rugosum]MBR7779539.1 response regulator transcription factor [Undibacterium rugosum]